MGTYAQRLMQWGRRPAVWVTCVVAAAAVAAVPLGVRSGGEDAAVSGVFQPAVIRDLDVTIDKEGELQAVNYIEIYNRSGHSTQILELVKEGTRVKKGDVLCVLDSLTVQQRLEETAQELRSAQSMLTIAQEMLEIQKSQNLSNVRAAETTLRLAKLELSLYEDGTYPQLLENAVTAMEMARLDLKNKEEELLLSRRLFSQGFVTAAEVKKGEMAERVAQNEVRKAQTSLTVLRKYTYEMEMARLNTAVAQAEQNLERVRKENASMMAQRLAEVHEQEEEVKEETQQKRELEQELAACNVKAPEDGIVIYASSVDRSAREPIQAGTMVRNRQLILTLPDVRRMKAVLQLSESQRARLDTARGHRATVRALGVEQPLGATLTAVSIMPDSSQRFWNPDVKEYAVDLTLDVTPAGLQPGISASATILVDRIPRALVVPVGAVYMTGENVYVFVRGKESGGLTPRKVVLGALSATHVQVLDGLIQGEEVLLLGPGQGRSLLERAGIRIEPAHARTQPVDPDAPPAAAAPPAAEEQAEQGEDGGGQDAAAPANAAEVRPQRVRPRADEDEDAPRGRRDGRDRS